MSLDLTEPSVPSPTKPIVSEEKGNQPKPFQQSGLEILQIHLCSFAVTMKHCLNNCWGGLEPWGSGQRKWPAAQAGVVLLEWSRAESRSWRTSSFDFSDAKWDWFQTQPMIVHDEKWIAAGDGPSRHSSGVLFDALCCVSRIMSHIVPPATMSTRITCEP